MADEKHDADPNLADDEQMDFGDEVEGVDPDVLEQAAGEAGGDDEGEGGAGQQQTQAASGSDAGQQGGKGTPQSIPYDRFAEVNSKRKAAEEAAQAEREARIRLEEQLRMLQQQPQQSAVTAAQAATPVDTKALIKERNAALLEGDDDRVAEIEETLEAERVRQAEERAVARIRKESEEANAKAQNTELQRVAAEIVANYPFLNSASADADADAIEDVMALRDRGIAKGLSPADALRKAVERFKPAFDARVSEAGTGATVDPAAASKMRNAKVANQQPPAMKGGMSAGAVPNLPDVNKMSVDEWAKLPDAERERLLV